MASDKSSSSSPPLAGMGTGDLNPSWFSCNSGEWPPPHPSAGAGSASSSPRSASSVASSTLYPDPIQKVAIAQSSSSGLGGLQSHATSTFHIPPPKRMFTGSWVYTAYVPIWTDPDWDGNFMGVDNNGKPIRLKSLTKTLRPAQLAVDGNVTEFANRFGVYPERTDGRSRMSPTRASGRIFRDMESGTEMTGEEVMKNFANLAGQQNMALDDLIDKFSHLDKSSLPTNRDRLIAHFREELEDDEDWQSLMFPDITTDEAMEDGIFQMDDNVPPMDLTNDIHPFFAREQWAEPTWRGSERKHPRLLYQTRSHRGEYDPRRDDFVWKRMGPTLKLASRMLEFCIDHDPFWESLFNIFNRVPVPDSRDPRSTAVKRAYPPFKFDLSNSDENLWFDQARLLRDRGINAKEQTIKTLVKMVELDVGYDFGNDGHPTIGCTRLVRAADKISITIHAMAVWPLLVDGYSGSEQMLTSFLLAETLLHEFVHAISYAQFEWMAQPVAKEVHDIKSRSVLHLIMQLRHIMWKGSTSLLEPFFDHDTHNECGHAWENHFFGGTCWPITEVQPIVFRNLHYIPSGLALISWPSSEISEAKDTSNVGDPTMLNLTNPRGAADDYCTPIRVRQVTKFFTEAFWQTNVAKYGYGAFTLIENHPSKVFSRNETRSADHIWEAALDAKKITARDSAVLRKNIIIRFYLAWLINKHIHYPALAYRMERDADTWQARDRMIQNCSGQLIVILREAHIMEQYNKRANNPTFPTEQDVTWMADAEEEWQKLVDDMVRSHVDFKLPPGSGKLGSDTNNFFVSLGQLTANNNQRVYSKLRESQKYLLKEIGILQDQLVEIQALPAAQREALGKEAWGSLLPGRIEFKKKYADVFNQTMDVCDIPDKASWKASFTAILQQLTQIEKVFKEDIKTLDPLGWRDLLPAVTRIKKANRSYPTRICKLAQKEVRKMSQLDLEVIERIAQRFPPLDPRTSFSAYENPDLDAALEQWGIELKGIKLTRAKPSLVEWEKDPILKQLYLDAGYKLGQKRGSEDEGEIEMDEGIAAEKRQKLRGNLPETPLKHKSIFSTHAIPFSATAPPIQTPFGTEIMPMGTAQPIAPVLAQPVFSPLHSQFGKPSTPTPPSTRQHTPSMTAFTNVTPSQFPLPTSGSSPWSTPGQPFPPATPTAYTQAVGPPSRPLVKSIFPAPKAFRASLTEDLVLDAQQKLKNAKPAPKTDPYSFLNVGGWGNTPREPKGLGESPELVQASKFVLPDPFAASPPRKETTPSPDMGAKLNKGKKKVSW